MTHRNILFSRVRLLIKILLCNIHTMILEFPIRKTKPRRRNIPSIGEIPRPKMVELCIEDKSARNHPESGKSTDKTIGEIKMKRTPMVAGNWKMNMTVKNATALIEELLPALKAQTAVERVVCPPFTALNAVSTLLKGSGVGCGAQDLYWEEKGAFTGEVAPNMVAELGEYVIIGHSERRTYFGETDETVNKKTLAALANGLTPIVCVGETLEENQSGKTAEVVARQVKAGLKGLSAADAAKVIVAYEPVWAIGTGLAATGPQANQVIAETIRKPYAEMYGEDAAQAIRVLYGGSVKGNNAAEFFGQPDIDGALVGGASLKAGDFMEIVNAAAK